MREFECRFDLPHDLKKLGETSSQIWERCKTCRKTFRWNKGFKGRVKNEEYLKEHIRHFAQDSGPTKRIFYKLYRPEKAVIHINL